MDSKLKEAENNLKEFLERYPEMQAYQDWLEEVMSKLSDNNARMTFLQNELLAKKADLKRALQDVKPKLNELEDEFKKLGIYKTKGPMQ